MCDIQNIKYLEEYFYEVGNGDKFLKKLTNKKIDKICNIDLKKVVNENDLLAYQEYSLLNAYTVIDLCNKAKYNEYIFGAIQDMKRAIRYDSVSIYRIITDISKLKDVMKMYTDEITDYIIELHPVDIVDYLSAIQVGAYTPSIFDIHVINKIRSREEEIEDKYSYELSFSRADNTDLSVHDLYGIASRSDIPTLRATSTRITHRPRTAEEMEMDL